MSSPPPHTRNNHVLIKSLDECLFPDRRIGVKYFRYMTLPITDFSGVCARCYLRSRSPFFTHQYFKSLSLLWSADAVGQQKLFLVPERTWSWGRDAHLCVHSSSRSVTYVACWSPKLVFQPESWDTQGNSAVGVDSNAMITRTP